ncbi:hypothetical protein [Frankia sp. EI5c]|uniref:hypothetical protein n=1 Tax=Frankia sp. EI5c TaxID=683316 RepID=UPI0012FFCE05|nr:hypothetical protein [Frankia sp. EI5c]
MASTHRGAVSAEVDESSDVVDGDPVGRVTHSQLAISAMGPTDEQFDVGDTTPTSTPRD